MRRLLLALPVAFALFAASGDVRADQARDESRAAFRRGVSLAQGGDYRSARVAFIEAYRLYPHPSILLNLGIARWRSDDLVAAEQDLARFLSDDGGASQEEVASARAALAAVRSRLGTVRVRVAPAGARASLDGQPLALVPGQAVEVRTTVGEHTLDAQASGAEPKRLRVVVEAARPSVVDLRLTSTAAATGAREPAAHDATSSRRTVGWVLVGTAGAAGVAGLIAGLRALALAREYNRQPAGAQEASLRSSGTLLRTLADVSFLVGIAAGGTGAYLLLTPDPNAPGTRAVLGPGFIGVRSQF